MTKPPQRGTEEEKGWTVRTPTRMHQLAEFDDEKRNPEKDFLWSECFMEDACPYARHETFVPAAQLATMREESKVFYEQSLYLKGLLAAANARVRQLEEAAEALREAQKAYMADRGNNDLGRKVGEAAERLDAALAAPPDTEATMRDRILAVLHKYPASKFATEVYAALNGGAR